MGLLAAPWAKSRREGSATFLPVDGPARRIITTPPAAVVALLGFVLLFGLGVAAGELLALVEGRDGSTGVDRSITIWAVAHRTDALTTLARGLSTVGSQAVLVPVTAVVAGLLLVRRRFALAGALIVAWGGALGLYTLVKLIVGRHRPPEVLWLAHATSSSFPSGHATQSLATYAALLLVAVVSWPRLRGAGRALVAVLVAVLVVGIGCSRVYLGVHWATDVLGGWLLAVGWLAIVAWIRDALTATARSAQPHQGPRGPRRRT